MLGNEEEIQKYYDNLLSSSANQYKNMYANLQGQQQEGQQKLYNDRNQIAVDNSQKVQQLRDYMANRNLLQSGENVDALLRQGTDYSNRIGENKTNEANLIRDMNNNRSQYAMQEQNAYNDINYKRLNDINELRQYQQQQAMQRASAAAKTSSSSSKVNISKDPYGNDNQKNIYEFYNDNKIGYGEKMDALTQVINDGGYSQEDRDYAERMRQALRSKEYYDAAYANYRG